MSKLTKLAAAVVVASGAVGANAGSFQAAGSAAVGVEAATTGSYSVEAAANSIVLTPAVVYSSTDRVTISLTNGATFGDSTYRLAQSGGNGNGDLTELSLITQTPAGSSELVFRVASATTEAGAEFVLTGSTAAGQAVTVNMPSLAAGGKVQVDAQAADLGGIYDFYTARELFRFANEFSANVDTVANAIVDVNEARLEFTTGTSDSIALDIREENIANGVTLNDEDSIIVTLSGDMSGLDRIIAKTDNVTRGTATIDLVANTATFEFSASDLKGNASAVLDVVVDEETPIATRTFTVKADLDFESETDKNLVAAGTAAGAWTINGLQAKVSQLSLNTTGFISWLKVANTGTAGVEVYADIIYTLADGTEGFVNSAYLGKVDAGGVGTVSEAAILGAMGNPTQLADVHLTVTVTGPNDTVHLIAEKKASEGRVSVPVYYNNGSGRSWFQ